MRTLMNISALTIADFKSRQTPPSANSFPAMSRTCRDAAAGGIYPGHVEVCVPKIYSDRALYLVHIAIAAAGAILHHAICIQ